jgi:hypothetical protein
MAQILLDAPVRNSGQVVDLNIFSSGGQDVMLSPPWQRRKLPWDALGENPCGALLPVPPPISLLWNTL